MTDNVSTVLSIIVVSFNTKELTLACLRSIYEQTRDVEYEAIVVDNDSKDGTATAIAREFPQVRLLTLDRNLGFAAANNYAARYATGQWLLLLNPDTLILDDAVGKMLAFAKDYEIRNASNGIFGGRTLDGNGRLDPTSVWGRPTLWSAFCMGFGLRRLFPKSTWFNTEAMPGWNRDTVREVDIVTGCFLLMRRILWERMGGFDPAFFMYGEEADLCLRARRYGVRCLLCPEAVIVHYGGASAQTVPDKAIRLLKARVQLLRRHWSPASAWIGVTLLQLWTRLKSVELPLASRANTSRGLRDPVWREVWERRTEWLT